jgi:hypothetical protein
MKHAVASAITTSAVSILLRHLLLRNIAAGGNHTTEAVMEIFQLKNFSESNSCFVPTRVHCLPTEVLPVSFGYRSLLILERP